MEPGPGRSFHQNGGAAGRDLVQNARQSPGLPDHLGSGPHQSIIGATDRGPVRSLLGQRHRSCDQRSRHAFFIPLLAPEITPSSGESN